jgi:biotin-dependent carboxylase-like uncharacterized protein
MTVTLNVEQAGPASTLQDHGRLAYLASGVSPSGAFDTLLLAVANRLVGNPVDTAAVEFVMAGDSFRVAGESCRIAVAGDCMLLIDGEKADAWRSHTVVNGQSIKIGGLRKGVRGYLAVAGGFDVPAVLGSRSVHTRTGVGPLNGQALSTGLKLPLVYAQAPTSIDLRFDAGALPRPRSRLRVVIGPQAHYFAQEDLARFLDGTFVLTAQCDRMGFQARGPEIPYRRDIPLISEGVALGSVQVLDQGLFILNMPDRQTVGGYPKLATVIGADIRELAQLPPGSRIQFEAIGVEAAQEEYRRYASLLRGLDPHLVPADPDLMPSDYLLAANLISGVYFNEHGAPNWAALEAPAPIENR